MQGNPTAKTSLSLPDLTSNDSATPNLWDTRFKVLIDNDAVTDNRLKDLETGRRASKTMQTVGSITALRGYTDALNGEVVYVPGVGVFRFYEDATDEEAMPWCILPDGNKGRWKIDMVPRKMLGTPGGVATLDRSGFVAQSVPKKSITADKLSDSAVSEKTLGHIHLNDKLRFNGDVGPLSDLLSTLGYQIRMITGGSDWREAPALNIKTLNRVFARTDRAQAWSQLQVFEMAEIKDRLILPIKDY